MFLSKLSLFILVGIVFSEDPCNKVFQNIPKNCKCTEKKLSCQDASDSDLQELGKVIAGQNLLFNEIYLKDLNVKALPKEVFQGVDTKSLQLENGKLGQITLKGNENVLSGFDSLMYLSFVNVSISPEATRNWYNFFTAGLRNLETLKISGGHRMGLDKLWSNFTGGLSTGLTQVAMEHGELAHLEWGSMFCKLCTSITLYDNRITIIENLQFHFYTESLRTLNLGKNYLTQLDKFTFYGMPNLEYLNLSENRISHLEIHTFFILRRRPLINLKDNEMQCHCRYSWLLHFSNIETGTCSYRSKQVDFFKHLIDNC